MVKPQFSFRLLNAGLAAAFLVSGLALLAMPAAASDAKAEAPTAGIVPIANYKGDFWEREFLFGDFGGKRTEWAEKGVQFNIDTVHWVDTIVDGGKTDDSEFGGNITYNLTVDLMRAGILPGALIQVRAETRHGSSGLLNAGLITPNNSAALSPTNYSSPDDGYDLALAQLSYLQMFSEHFGVIGGKLDLYGEGSPNEFAGGRGRTQFANWNLSFSTPTLLVPAATVGAGVVVLPNEHLNITSLLISGTECTNSDCFEDLDDKGGVSLTAASYQYNLDGLPGGLTGTFAYFFDKDFTDLDSITIGLGDGEKGLVGSDENESWLASFSFWQYVSVEGQSKGPLNLMNKKPDLEGWGLFGTLSFADPDTNPWKTSVAFGIGGRGVIPGRSDDLFGIGGYYNDLASARVISGSGFEENYWGMEAFYNIAIKPGVMLSANLQYLPAVEPDADDSLMITPRLQVLF